MCISYWWYKIRPLAPAKTQLGLWQKFGNYLDSSVSEDSSLGYYTTRIFVINTGHLALLQQRNLGEC
jgi:hypothetical protein